VNTPFEGGLGFPTVLPVEEGKQLIVRRKMISREAGGASLSVRKSAVLKPVRRGVLNGRAERGGAVRIFDGRVPLGYDHSSDHGELGEKEP